MYFTPKKISAYLFPLVFLFLLVGCEGAKKETSDATEEVDAASEDLGEKVVNIIHDVPPPSEVPYLIQATGSDFNGSLVNEASKADNYTTTNNKAALNLGVYATDIGYLIVYNKTQEALNYVESTKPLGEYLNLTNTFDAELFTRFEENLDSKDSLSALINQAIADAEDHLAGGGRSELAALLITGSFVEGLYIGTALVKNYPDDILPTDEKNLVLVPLTRVILNQHEPLIELIELLEGVDLEDQMSQDLLAELKELEERFSALDIEEKIQNEQGNLLLQDTTLDAIINQTGTLRDKITD